MRAIYDDNSLMPFGKYKGEKMANVPASYLIWLLDTNKCFGGLRDYIKDNKDVLELEIIKKNRHNEKQ